MQFALQIQLGSIVNSKNVACRFYIAARCFHSLDECHLLVMRKGLNSHQVVFATDTHDGSSVCSTIVGHTGSSPSTLPCFPGLYRLSSLFACNTSKEEDARQCALIRCASFKLDLATELDVQFESCNFQRHLRRQGFVPFDASFRTGSSQRFFNFI